MSLYLFIRVLLTFKIISSEIIGPTEKDQYREIIPIINELNRHLEIEWNLVFTLEVQDVDIVLDSLRIPAIILTKSNELQISLLHSHQLMSVVFLDKIVSQKNYEIVERQLELLKLRPILWIIREAKEKDLLNFAAKNWFSGFTRVLFFTRQGLYTYDPVPAIIMQRIWNIQDFVQTKEINDFKNYPLSLLFQDDYPFCFQYQLRSGKTKNTGFFYKIIQIFMQYYNFQEHQIGVLNYHIPSDIMILRERFYNNTLDVIPAIIYGFDFDNVARSNVIWNMKVYILAPYPPALPKMSYLHYPFTFSTKITILLLLVLYAAAVMFVYSHSNSEDYIDFSKSFLYVLVSFMFQNHFDFKMKTTRQKIVLSLLFLNGFIITNLYLAKLSSIMVKNIYETKLETLDDLDKTSLNILMAQDTYELAGNYPYIHGNILKKTTIVEPDYVERANFDLNNTYLLMVPEDKMEFLFFEQQFLKTPRMYNIEEDILSEPVFFTIRKNLPYLQLFNRYLLYARESGIFDKVITDTYLDGISSGKLRFFTDDGEDLFLNWESFCGILIYFIFGLALSVVVFIVELILPKYAKKRFM